MTVLGYILFGLGCFMVASTGYIVSGFDFFPLNATTGLITLVGASRFRGGFLGGTDCSITVIGTFTPIP